MKLAPKEFQVEAVMDMQTKFEKMQADIEDEPGALLLNAPTGSGKTLIATALIDSLLAGGDGEADDDPSLTFLWLTDQPQLNKQTYDKMLATSSVLTPGSMVIVDGSFDAERLAVGKLYFLNTQKLGVNSTLVRHGDDRTFTLWESLASTVEADPSRFVLFLDEAHRGSRGSDAKEAETIMQRFVKGDEEMPAVPLVVGISATPDRFVQLCSDAKRLLRRTDVDPAVVRQSGLLKDFVDLYHPDEEQPGDMTMLQEAVATWQKYTEAWGSYDLSDGESPVRPVLVVQVEDARKGKAALSATDLPKVIDILQKHIGSDGEDTAWLAHTFETGTDQNIGRTHVRYIEPSAIDGDAHVKVVLFKTALNTGWDCPRAETMASFRRAKDGTAIAQLVGRMVRTPLARRVESDEYLNTVALYLPYFDKAAVERVIERLSGDPDNVPPTQARAGKQVVQLGKAAGKDGCFSVLEGLPTYVIPRTRPMKPVQRLARFAALLGELGFESDPVKTYRATLVKVLEKERKRLAKDAEFMKRLRDDAVLIVRRRRHAYAADEASVPAGPQTTKAKVALENIDDLYDQAGRLLGEGLHKEYLRVRLAGKGRKPRPENVKLELHAIVSSEGVLDKVKTAATELRQKWTRKHKAAIRTADEKRRQAWRALEGAGTDPEQTTIVPPENIDGTKADEEWKSHLYVESDGTYREDFRSSWESRALRTELERDDVIGWLRNQDRKAWSLCVPRKQGTKWHGVYPDLIIFRQTDSGVIADVVDPHLLGEENAPGRARAMAEYAASHSDAFGRIELLIYEDDKDESGKRLDLMDEKTRQALSEVTTHAHLAHLFDGA